MVDNKSKEECCGCSACASVCKHDAIKMVPDAMGFLYPVIDYSRCIDCGLCDSVCAFNDHYDVKYNCSEPICYGARHKDLKEVETSRSGAAFIAISDYILKKGGVVYGAGYTDHFRVVHKRATKKEERDEFKGSKYVQSDLNSVFSQVKADLRNGLIVLFSGTPCQTAGLKSYISEHLKGNLFLLDIICHGVPSPYFWRDYILYFEKEQGSEISTVNFRDKKDIGWSSHKESFILSNGKRYIGNSYTYFFYSNLLFRNSCYNCHYTNTKRPSDITLGDFWGWERTNPDMNLDDKGLSLILCNTVKGHKLFEAIKHDLNYFSSRLEDCMQSRLEYPTQLNPMRNQFEKEYSEHGFSYVFSKYQPSKPSILEIVKNKMKKACEIIYKK